MQCDYIDELGDRGESPLLMRDSIYSDFVFSKGSGFEYTQRYDFPIPRLCSPLAMHSGIFLPLTEVAV